MARVPLIYVTSPEQWSVLTAAARFEIIEAMQDLAPCGIKAVAERLGVKPDTLYRHFDILIHAGYITPAGFRRVPRATEQLFDLTADDFQVRFDTRAQAGPANDMIRDTAAVFLKRMKREVDRTASARAFDTTDQGRNLILLSEYVRLTSEEFKQLRILVRQAKDLMDGTRRRAGGQVPTQLYSVLVAATPVMNTRSADARGATNGTPLELKKIRVPKSSKRKQSNPDASARGRKSAI